MSEATIRQLILQLSSGGSQEAWQEFLDQYSSAIFQVVCHFERDRDQSADCFQFVCEQLIANRCHRLRKFKPDGPAKFSTWLRAVVRNLCLDWQRKRYGRQRVFRSIAGLSLFDQEVFRLIYQQGLTHEEARHLLASSFAGATDEQLKESRERIETTLTPRQRSLLTLRPHYARDGGAGTGLGPDLMSVPDPRPDPETEAIRNERTRMLSGALKTIAARDRLLLRLRFEEGLTLDQCARLLDLDNAQRVDRRIREVLDRLRRAMS